MLLLLLLGMTLLNVQQPARLPMEDMPEFPGCETLRDANSRKSCADGKKKEQKSRT
jgi:hypothetical protein